jgi:polyisoprenoid-binding protein YceI
VVVEVPVAEMKTGNDDRDVKMREMFQSDRHPRIRAAARDIDTDRVREGIRNNVGGKAPLEISLAIRGVERKVQATASNLKEDGPRVSFDLEFPLSLKEFDLKPPSVLGFIRVADRVLVKGTFSLDVSKAP